MSAPIIIYDGDCKFCLQCIKWVSKKLEINPLAFQSADLSQFGLTLEECSKQVFVIEGDKTYSAIAAVIYLLRRRGNNLLSNFLKLLGPLGSWGYFWVAEHRRSFIVRLLGKLLSRISK